MRFTRAWLPPEQGGLHEGTSRSPREGWPAYLAVTVMGCLAFLGWRTDAEAVSAIVADWTLTPHPPVVGPATFSFTLADTTGRPVTGEAVPLEGNMAHAGMQPILGSAAEVAPGRYGVLLTFAMGGDGFSR